MISIRTLIIGIIGLSKIKIIFKAFYKIFGFNHPWLIKMIKNTRVKCIQVFWGL